MRSALSKTLALRGLAGEWPPHLTPPRQAVRSGPSPVTLWREPQANSAHGPHPAAAPHPCGSLDPCEPTLRPCGRTLHRPPHIPTGASPSRPRAGLRARAESSQQPERGRGALRPPRPGPPLPVARGRSTLSRSSISFSWARRSYSSRVKSPRRGPTSSSAGARPAGATSSWASLQIEGIAAVRLWARQWQGSPGWAQPHLAASSLRCSFSASCHCFRRRASSTRRCWRSSRLALFWAISSSGLSSSWGQAPSVAGCPSPGSAGV